MCMYARAARGGDGLGRRRERLEVAREAGLEELGRDLRVRREQRALEDVQVDPLILGRRVLAAQAEVKKAQARLRGRRGRGGG